MAEKKLYHVNKKGEVRPCGAQKRACRFGAANHFATEEEAIKSSQEDLRFEYGSDVPQRFRKSPLPGRGSSRAKAVAPPVAISPRDVPGIMEELKQLPERDTPVRFMENALREFQAFSTIADGVANCYVARNSQGVVSGVATVVSHDEEVDVGEEDLVPVKYDLITYMGSTGGNGRALLGECRRAARERGATLMLEPTGDSAAFWRHMGAVEDPMELGLHYHGFTD